MRALGKKPDLTLPDLRLTLALPCSLPCIALQALGLNM